MRPIDRPAVSIQHAGRCASNHPLYEIDGVVQHIVTASEIRAGDMAKLQCPNRPIDRPGPHRALGGALALAASVFVLIVGWYALFAWIGGGA